MSYPIMNEKQKDALSEAGNIAAGYAASALAELIGGKVMIDATECKSIQIEKIPQALGDETQFVVGLNMLLPTSNLCSFLMFLPYKTAKAFYDIVSKNKLGTTKEISYKEFIKLSEIETICLCEYLNALSKLLGEQYIPTPPAVACDIIGSILEDVIPSIDTINDNAIIIKTDFVHITGSGQNKGNFLYIPDRDSRDAILKTFNVNNLIGL